MQAQRRQLDHHDRNDVVKAHRKQAWESGLREHAPIHDTVPGGNRGSVTATADSEMPVSIKKLLEYAVKTRLFGVAGYNTLGYVPNKQAGGAGGTVGMGWAVWEVRSTHALDNQTSALT
eukprot:878218-Rhodomonas_salina.2